MAAEDKIRIASIVSKAASLLRVTDGCEPVRRCVGSGAHAPIQFQPRCLFASKPPRLSPPRNPHSARRTDGCPTHRDFAPWRFSDAGRSSPWMVPSCRRPKTLYERELVKNFPHGSSFRLP